MDVVGIIPARDTLIQSFADEIRVGCEYLMCSGSLTSEGSSEAVLLCRFSP